MSEEEKTYTQADIDELKGKVAEFRHTNVGLMKQLETFDGVDVKEYRSLRTKLQELEAGAKGVSSDDLRKIRENTQADLLQRYSDPVAAAEELPWAAAVLRENRGLKLDSVVKAEMASAGARSERLDALFKLTADRFDLTADGKPTLRDHPAVEVSKYVRETLKGEYPEFYNGSGSTGGGASRSSAAGGGTRNIIAAGDGDAFMANLQSIADGTTRVE